jgi:FkbM family methyltransferase
MRLIKDTLKGMFASLGYDIHATPKALIEHPSARLSTDLELIFSHYFLRKNNFFFVQIGACDGIFADQFNHLVKTYNLRGILIEPQQDMYAALVRNYAGNSNLVLLNTAIGKEECIQQFYRVKNEYLNILPYARGISSLKRDSIERAIKIYFDELFRKGESLPPIDAVIESEAIQCSTLSNVLETYHVEFLDMLLIDTEGYDFEIIKTIDFKKIKPPIIRFEHSHLSTTDTEACYDLLIRHGYLLGRGPSDTVAYAEEQLLSSTDTASTAARRPGEIQFGSTNSGKVE